MIDVDTLIKHFGPLTAQAVLDLATDEDIKSSFAVDDYTLAMAISRCCVPPKTESEHESEADDAYEEGYTEGYECGYQIGSGVRAPK